MKFLALESECEGTGPESFAPHLRDEARAVWDLYRAGLVREVYFRSDRPTAVLVLECEDIAAAEGALSSLPLVRHGLIRFEIVPLEPYPGFARLFAQEP